MNRDDYRAQQVQAELAKRQQVKKDKPKKPKSVVVLQLPFAAVKKNAYLDSDGKWKPSYDIWQFNIFKQKWVRLSNTACGFASVPKKCAQETSDEVEKAIKAHLPSGAQVVYPVPL